MQDVIEKQRLFAVLAIHVLQLRQAMLMFALVISCRLHLLVQDRIRSAQRVLCRANAAATLNSLRTAAVIARSRMRKRENVG